MVIETNLVRWAVTRIIIDTGSSANILFASTFDDMKLNRNLLQPAGRPLYGFRGKQVKTIGKITLLVTFSDQSNSRTEHITFNVVDMLSNYNAIFGRGVTNVFSAIIHLGSLYEVTLCQRHHRCIQRSRPLQNSRRNSYPGAEECTQP